MKSGDLIRVIRSQTGLSQTNFAQRIGASRSSVNQWENDYHKPKVENVLTIIEQFKPKQGLADKLLVSVGAGSVSSTQTTIDKTSSSEIINNIVNALFDQVIAGEITFRKGADPAETAKHIYNKIYGADQQIEEPALKMVAEKNGSYNK